MSLLTRLLFPPKCSACGEILDWYEKKDRPKALCSDCMKQWKNEKLDVCGSCNKRVTECACVTEELQRARCATFRKLVFYRHGKGERVQNRLIFHIKKKGDRQTVDLLAEELLPALQTLSDGAKDPVLTYVPRSLGARLEYGVDQARELATALSALSGIPCRRLLTRNIGHRPSQKGLSAEERVRNAKKVFRLCKGVELRGKRVILVDDIITTGATAAACVRLLHRVGALEVFCLAPASDDINQN